VVKNSSQKNKVKSSAIGNVTRLAVVFKQFCEREMVDPVPFLKFCLRTYISGWQIVNNYAALEWAWKDYLTWEYWHLFNTLATKESK
jgi:hypothetical protein